LFLQLKNAENLQILLRGRGLLRGRAVHQPHLDVPRLEEREHDPDLDAADVDDGDRVRDAPLAERERRERIVGQLRDRFDRDGARDARATDRVASSCRRIVVPIGMPARTKPASMTEPQ
jgi:hypothetical protein